MLLKSVYSPGHFSNINFKLGFNLIYGVKSNNSAGSLNGIGKSLLLDFINFGLLSNFKKDSSRLFAASEKMKDATIYLEIDINNVTYLIARSFSKSSYPRFGRKGIPLKTYSLVKLRKLLLKTIFLRPNFSFPFSQSTWLKLLPFFIKVQMRNKVLFAEPLKYLSSATLASHLPFHFFFLNINNSALLEYAEITKKLNSIHPSIKEIESSIIQRYSVPNMEAGIKLFQLKQIDYAELKESLSNFKLLKQYSASEEKADQLTLEIKNQYEVLASYESQINSLKFEKVNGFEINTTSIGDLYSDFNILLGENVKRTLEETIEFFNNLALSRTNFLNNEIVELESRVSFLQLKIDELEMKRRDIYNFLSENSAIDDLKSAQLQLNEFIRDFYFLQVQVANYEMKLNEKIELDSKKKILEVEVSQILSNIDSTKYEFSNTLKELYEAIYSHLSVSPFDIKNNIKDASLFDIKVLDGNSFFSSGNNNGRVLVYDLAILFYMINNHLPSPHFIIHDGIFSQIDKSHLFKLLDYLEKKATDGIKFQYILTLNENGTLGDHFNENDKYSPQNLKDMAIKVLSKNNKLIGDF